MSIGQIAAACVKARRNQNGGLNFVVASGKLLKNELGFFKRDGRTDGRDDHLKIGIFKPFGFEFFPDNVRIVAVNAERPVRGRDAVDDDDHAANLAGFEQVQPFFDESGADVVCAFQNNRVRRVVALRRQKMPRLFEQGFPGDISRDGGHDHGQQKDPKNPL